MRTLDDTSLTPVERRAVQRLADELRADLGDALRAVWLYGSRARGESRREDSDVDVYVVTEGGRPRDDARVGDIAWRVSEEVGLSPFALSVQVRDPRHVAYKRGVEDFFIAEVDRDKVVLAGAP